MAHLYMASYTIVKIIEADKVSEQTLKLTSVISFTLVFCQYIVVEPRVTRSAAALIYQLGEKQIPKLNSVEQLIKDETRVASPSFNMSYDTISGPRRHRAYLLTEKKLRSKYVSLILDKQDKAEAARVKYAINVIAKSWNRTKTDKPEIPFGRK